MLGCAEVPVHVCRVRRANGGVARAPWPVAVVPLLMVMVTSYDSGSAHHRWEVAVLAVHTHDTMRHRVHFHIHISKLGNARSLVPARHPHIL